MNSVLNTLSEYTPIYIPKNITSYTFLLAFKIVKNLQCIPKPFRFKFKNMLLLLSARSLESFSLKAHSQV